MAPWRLHGWPLSHWCVSAEKMLDLKGIPYERVHAPYGDHTKVIELSGQDYIPWLETAPGKGLVWHQIPDFLEKERPTPTLYPGGSRATCRLVEDWAHQVVEEAVWKYVCADVPATIADSRERWIFVEMQERKRGPLEVMAHRKPEFLAGVEHVCGLAQDQLGDNPYLLGEAPSLADLALWGSLAPLWLTGNAIPARFERLRAWQQRVAKTP